MYAGEPLMEFTGNIWDTLAAKASPENLATVQQLVRHAHGLLTAIRDTFPKYTLHDRQHAENVLALMEQLLGDSTQHLTDLEAGMLVLGSYFHDIGMVYTLDELENIASESEFKRFLEDHPTAYLRSRSATTLPIDVIEDYCRARHADRVFEQLDRIDPELLRWSGVTFRSPLAEICRSHNIDPASLKDDLFDTSFMGVCDLRFCAVLLRLADALDFDDSRAPSALYRHLGLSHKSNARETTSDLEWTKHLASRGFRFPEERDGQYRLGIVASPKQPNVEHAIRAYIDCVELELAQCRNLVKYCSRRWANITLPTGVDRKDIISDGYIYGEYQFSLDRQAVLQLFMGDDLYEEPHVFVRELLQNSIDACRLAAAFAVRGVHPPSIDISIWDDSAGYVWVRVDDGGTGMDERIIRDYLLAVGRSYYKSAQLEADLMQHSAGMSGFKAISRFGIGILSCFLVGDCVEVSSLRISPDGTVGEPVRLTMHDVDEFFVLQKPPLRASDMPGPHGDDDGFRRRPGTSVAVRLSPAKSSATVEQLVELARNYLFYPPVMVRINGEGAGRTLSDLDRPLLPNCRLIDISRFRTKNLLQYQLPYRGPLTLVALPLDLSAVENTPDLRGQLLSVSVDSAPISLDLLVGWPEEVISGLPDALRKSCASAVTETTISVSRTYSPPAVHVKLARQIDVAKLRHAYVAVPKPHAKLATEMFGFLEGNDLEKKKRWSESYEIPLCEIDNSIAARTDWRCDNTWLGHNGLVVPKDLVHDIPTEDQMYGRLHFNNKRPDALFGPIVLLDGLRPDVAVSRDFLRGVPFQVHSALNYAFRRALAVHRDLVSDQLFEALVKHPLLTLPPRDPYTLRELLRDPLVARGHWDSTPVLAFAAGHRAVGLLSAVEARDRTAAVASAGTEGLYCDMWHSPSDWLTRTEDEEYLPTFEFDDVLQSTVLQTALDLELRASRTIDHDLYGEYDDYESLYGECDDYESWYDWKLYVRSSARPAGLQPGLLTMPPLTVVPYSADAGTIVAVVGNPVNLNHPFVEWFIVRAPELEVRLPSVFGQIRRALLDLTRASILYSMEQLDEAVNLIKVAVTRIKRFDRKLAPPIGSEVLIWDDPVLRS